jgi:S-adenosylmethionine:tRNA ribosyltransferase-isomerase
VFSPVVRTADFDFSLPPELIAQTPGAERDGSRLLVLNRAGGRREHRQFRELPALLRAGDLLVLNDSRVIPARLRGRKADTGGDFEILLLEELGPLEWWTLLRPGKRVRPGSRLIFTDADGQITALTAEVVAKNDEGHCRLRFAGAPSVLSAAERLGEVPLPPYIRREAGASAPEDRERYQTVYARQPGSVAAPTAGLHLTAALLDTLQGMGVGVAFVTLHVGIGTFAPVKADHLDTHRMHEERFSLPPETAAALNAAKAAGGRVVAVGTTTMRVLESVARGFYDGFWGEPAASAPVGAPLPAVAAGRTRIFIRPPADFRVVDALITNFHLPQSTLLMLVSAFARPGETAGRDLILETYAEAVRERYRFFSYGDAMFIH